MPRPVLQQPESGAVAPSNWESSPWNAQERVVEEPLRLGAREQPLQLSDENVVEAALDGDSIRRV